MKAIAKSLLFVIVCLSSFGSIAQNKTPIKTMIAVSPADGSLPIAPMPSAPTTPVSAGVTGVGQVVVGSGFAVTTSDRNIREVLQRWARNAGWVHSPEHWTIDRDLPISGTADASVFGNEFMGAARKLLASSEFTDRPVQPCFYSNNVVRVVPKAELCDKSK